jgi:uncharacterized membrane protein YjjP (DUF1212 family)
MGQGAASKKRDAPTASHQAAGGPPVSAAEESDDLGLILRTAAFLFNHGQSTTMTLVAVRRLNKGLTQSSTLIPTWTSLMLLDDRHGERPRIAAVQPTTLHMRRVSAVMRAVDEALDGPLERKRIRSALDDAQHLPTSSTVVFTAACAVAAAALAVIFGARGLGLIGLIAVAAGAGGIVRRLIARYRGGPLLQAFAAAVIGGAAGAIALHTHTGENCALAPVCVAMVLVPGPHILIGAMDLLSLRVSLGLARITYATLLLTAIAAGLGLGLRFGGQALPLSSVTTEVPFLADMLAAGAAAACFPVFFNSPYRIIGWPVAVGMAVHALHWWAITHWHAGLPVAALLSCLAAAAVLGPIAHWYRIPFTAIGFAAVVSMVPGMYVFRTVTGFVDVVNNPSPALLTTTASNGSVAVLVIVCMAIGLTVPNQIRDSIVEAKLR